MIEMLRASLIASAFSLAVTSGVAAKPQPGTATIAGSWQLNTKASKVLVPMKSATRVYTVVGNRVTMLANGIEASGKTVSLSFAAAFDGKFYPIVGNPLWDTIAISKVDAHTFTAVLRKGSAVSATSRTILSRDGNHLTITNKIGTPPGKLVTTTLVFDRK